MTTWWQKERCSDCKPDQDRLAVTLCKFHREAPMMAQAILGFVRDRSTCPTSNGKDLEVWEQFRAILARIEGDQ